jgi:hypothetical protein
VRRLLLTIAGLGLASLLGLAVHASELKAGDPGTGKAPPPVPAKPATCDLAKGECGTYGTTIEFRKTPQSAAARALKEEKLVFVLHVSGNFEDPTFT